MAQPGAAAESQAQDAGGLPAETPAHWGRRVAWAQQVSAAVSAIHDSVLLDCYVLEVIALVALLKQMQSSIKEFDLAIAETSHRHPCWTIAQSLPGAGLAMAPRLLAAMGNGKRYQN